MIINNIKAIIGPTLLIASGNSKHPLPNAVEAIEKIPPRRLPS